MGWGGKRLARPAQHHSPSFQVAKVQDGVVADNDIIYTLNPQDVRGWCISSSPSWFDHLGDMVFSTPSPAAREASSPHIAVSRIHAVPSLHARDTGNQHILQLCVDLKEGEK